MRDSFRECHYEPKTDGVPAQKQGTAPHQIIEIGCVTIVDWRDKFYLFRNVTVLEAQEPDSLPFAIINAGEDSYKISVLVAFIIAEHIKGGELRLPDFLTDGIEFGPNIGYNEETGNIGTVSDNIAVRLVDKNGKDI